MKLGWGITEGVWKYGGMGMWGFVWGHGSSHSVFAYQVKTLSLNPILNNKSGDKLRQYL
jgi:hypothetical protein